MSVNGPKKLITHKTKKKAGKKTNKGGTQSDPGTGMLNDIGDMVKKAMGKIPPQPTGKVKSGKLQKVMSLNDEAKNDDDDSLNALIKEMTKVARETEGKKKNEDIGLELNLQKAEEQLRAIFEGKHKYIKIGGGNLNKLARRNIMQDFTKILSTAVGYELIMEITGAKHLVTIKDEGKAASNAFHVPWLKHGLNSAAYAKDYDSDNMKVTKRGKGDGSVVLYRGDGGYKDKTRVYPSDVILFHELVHALHTSQGRLIPPTKTTKTMALNERFKWLNARKNLAPDLAQWAVNLEEWATVGLGPWENESLTENKYRANRLKWVEAAKPGLSVGMYAQFTNNYAQRLSYLTPQDYKIMEQI